MGQYEDSLGKDHPAIARVVTENQLAAQRGHEQPGVIFQRQGMTIAQSLAAEGTIFQSGIPFVIFAGDGGSNGFAFGGTGGDFTLSAEPMTNFWLFLASGGYIYLPAGAGGLATGGLYWAKMTSGTTGTVYANTYSGSGQPPFIASPTALPNLTAGRITQSTSEIVVCSARIPGGSMGPNGILRAVFSARANNSANNKTLKVKSGPVGGSLSLFGAAIVTIAPSVDYECLRQNVGIETVQTSSSLGSNRMHSASGVISAGERTTIDTTVDNELQMTLQLAANTDSVLGILRLATVQYGA